MHQEAQLRHKPKRQPEYCFHHQVPGSALTHERWSLRVGPLWIGLHQPTETVVELVAMFGSITNTIPPAAKGGERSTHPAIELNCFGLLNAVANHPLHRHAVVPAVANGLCIRSSQTNSSSDLTVSITARSKQLQVGRILSMGSVALISIWLRSAAIST